MIDLKAFREDRGITQGDVVRVIKEQYRGYDNSLNSKVENPEKYGVRLVNDAERLLEESFTTTAKQPRRQDKRRLPYRISCRMSKTLFERLQHALKLNGYDTMQAGLTEIIKSYLEEQKSEPL